MLPSAGWVSDEACRLVGYQVSKWWRFHNPLVCNFRCSYFSPLLLSFACYTHLECLFYLPLPCRVRSRFMLLLGDRTALTIHKSWYWWNSLTVLFPNLHCELFRAGSMLYLHAPPCEPDSVLCVQDNFRMSSRTGLGLWILGVGQLSGFPL